MTTPTPVLDPRKTALIMVDMQNDFCSPAGFYAQAGNDISALEAAVEPNRALLARVRGVGMMTVFTRIVRNEALGPTEQRHRILPRRWFSYGKRLIGGSWGVELVDGLAPLPGDIVLDKYGYSAFHATNLEEQLRDCGITTLLLSGVVTYACVLATAFAGFDRGFDVVMVKEATGSWMKNLGPASYEIADLLLGHSIGLAELAFEGEASVA
jgi:nicotinamidase-related amidase